MKRTALTGRSRCEAGRGRARKRHDIPTNWQQLWQSARHIAITASDQQREQGRTWALADLFADARISWNAKKCQQPTWTFVCPARMAGQPCTQRTKAGKTPAHSAAQAGRQ